MALTYSTDEPALATEELVIFHYNITRRSAWRYNCRQHFEGVRESIVAFALGINHALCPPPPCHVAVLRYLEREQKERKQATSDQNSPVPDLGACDDL
ncbi:unnamed protein product [Mesocestoides corti]|uniref:ALOG domain-containing protein n=1 Tax=Mesocestoides corti TaxID=53468 RepID=A0A0R3UL01_MESCO|nr:unnamed protein product [Mesocestoides corti]